MTLVEDYKLCEVCYKIQKRKEAFFGMRPALHLFEGLFNAIRLNNTFNVEESLSDLT